MAVSMFIGLLKNSFKILNVNKLEHDESIFRIKFVFNYLRNNSNNINPLSRLGNNGLSGIE